CQHMETSLGEGGDGLQLGVVTSGQHHKVPAPLLDDALQEMRTVVQMEVPAGRTRGAGIKTLYQRHKGLALRPRRGVDMDIRGEPWIGSTQGQGRMEVAWLVKDRVVYRHSIVSSQGG